MRSHRRGAFASAASNATLETHVEAGLRALAGRARGAPDQATAPLLACDETHGAFLRYVLTAISGAEPEAYSSGDAAEEDALESNWLVTGGMGRFISDHLAAGLPIRLGTTVRTVDFRGPTVRLDTSAGRLRTNAVIITAPVGVLADGRPGFRPTLPAWKTDAIESVAMGCAEKIALRFSGSPFGDDVPHFLTVEQPGGLLGFHIEPGPPAVAIAYTGGDRAAAVAAMGEDAAVAMAMDYLAHAYGESLRGQLVARTATAWARDAWALGSYSAARPGGHHQRTALAAPLTDYVRFAGEATLLDAFATAHGAWLSGRREAEAVARAMGAAPPATPSASG
jgi:monoamine oxidase